MATRRASKRARGRPAIVPRRLSLPPPLFVGRARELARARLALGRRPVLVVWGLGGIGKSAFVRALVDRRDRARAQEIRALPGAGLREIADALVTMVGAETMLPRDEVSLCGAIVDLADEHGVTLVLDDAHDLERSALELLLREFAAYATRGTLLVTTRVRPGLTEMAEQLLQLPPLGASDVEAILRACRPELAEDEVAGIVERSAGSPWLARCLATNERASLGSVTGSLDAELRRAVGLLRWLGQPAPEALVDRIAGRAGVAAELALRALAERIGDEIRLHDVAREHLADVEPLHPEVARAALRHAVEDPGHSAACIALELAAALDDRATLAQIVSDHGERILDDGLAARAWRSLARLAPDVQRGFRLRCAARSATRAAFEWAVSLEPPDDPDESAYWGQCVVDSGHRGGLRPALLRAVADGSPPAAILAASLLCRTAKGEDEVADALAIVERLDAVEGNASALRHALAARVLLVTERCDESLRNALAAVRELEATPASARDASRIEAGFLVFTVLVALGWYATAAIVVRQVPVLADERSMNAGQLYTAALYALDSGDMTAAMALTERLARRSDSGKATRFLLAFLRFRAALAFGRYDDARQHARALEVAASTLRDPGSMAWARIATLDLVMAEGTEAPPLSWPDDVPRPAGVEAVMLEAHERLACAARGDDRGFEDLVAPASAPAANVFVARVEVASRELRRDHAGAQLAMARAIGLARQHGLRRMELELLATDAGLRRRAGDEEGIARIGRELVALADQTGLLRYAAMGRELAGQGEVVQHRGALSVEPEACAVQLGGRRISLVRNKVGLRLLEELVRAGGQATKEHLVKVVWDRRTYTPARDDKRLQMAIRRLRVLLERDPSTPEILLTTPDGYALADRAP